MDKTIDELRREYDEATLAMDAATDQVDAKITALDDLFDEMSERLVRAEKRLEEAENAQDQGVWHYLERMWLAEAKVREMTAPGRGWTRPDGEEFFGREAVRECEKHWEGRLTDVLAMCGCFEPELPSPDCAKHGGEPE